MKKILKSVLAGSLAFGLLYLIGSFGNVSFDLSKWGQLSLMSVSIFGLVAFISAFSFEYCREEIEKEDKNDKKICDLRNELKRLRNSK